MRRNWRTPITPADLAPVPPGAGEAKSDPIPTLRANLPPRRGGATIPYIYKGIVRSYAFFVEKRGHKKYLISYPLRYMLNPIVFIAINRISLVIYCKTPNLGVGVGLSTLEF
jgi:hypothetical protein